MRGLARVGGSPALPPGLASARASTTARRMRVGSSGVGREQVEGGPFDASVRLRAGGSFMDVWFGVAVLDAITEWFAVFEFDQARAQSIRGCVAAHVKFELAVGGCQNVHHGTVAAIKRIGIGAALKFGQADPHLSHRSPHSRTIGINDTEPESTPPRRTRPRPLRSMPRGCGPAAWAGCGVWLVASDVFAAGGGVVAVDDRGVVAGAAVDGVVAAADGGQGVVAGAAVELVGVKAAVELVVA